MHRTEGTNNDGNTFTDGPPGTTVEENWLNAVQNEIVNVVEGAGLTLKTAATETGNQLLSALQSLFIEQGDEIGKNAIINGDFRISQRGTSGTASYTAATTPANNDDTYLHDRWLLLSDGNDIVDVSQSTEAPTGGLLSCALDVETINKKFGIFQPIEQKNCAHMIGGNVSLSFYAKVTDTSKLDNIKAAIVSWDGAADTITSDIVSAWNAEDTTPTLVANWTFENTPANLGVTTSWAKYSIPNIPVDTASTKNIGVFIWSDGFCDTTTNFLYITNVQLEKNSVVSEYDWRSIANELTLCQRYYCKSYDYTTTPGTVTNIGRVVFSLTAVANADHTCSIHTKWPVDMRTAPSVSIYSSSTGTINKASMANGDINSTVQFIASSGCGGISGTNGAVSTSRFIQFHYTADAEL